MKDKKLYLEIKPFILLITYVVALGFVVLNFQFVLDIINTIISYFKPMFIALGIAYVFNLPMKIIERFILSKTKNHPKLASKARGIALFLSTLLVLFVVIAFFVLIVPQLMESITRLVENLSNYVNTLIGNVTTFLQDNNINNEIIQENLKTIADIDWNEVGVSITEWFLANGESISQNAGKSINQVINSIISETLKFGGSFGTWFTGFMISFYLLASKEKFIRQARKLIAAVFKRDHAETIFNIGRRANHIYSNFITGQLLEAFIFSGLVLIVMTILKMEYALLICLVILVASLIPVFGAVFAMCFGALLIFSVNPMQAIWFIVVYQLLQQFENNVIYPKVVGESVGLPGVWVLLSILIFGSMFGLVGMLLAVPTSALIYQLISEYINFILRKKNVEIDIDGYVNEVSEE